jgi:hypothetical protein
MHRVIVLAALLTAMSTGAGRTACAYSPSPHATEKPGQLQRTDPVGMPRPAASAGVQRKFINADIRSRPDRFSWARLALPGSWQ